MSLENKHGEVRRYLACDLGADSGRVMLGELADGAFSLRELRRFPTQGTRHADGSLRWDMARILGEIAQGLRAAQAQGAPVRSFSADSWGVDYVWMKDGAPVDLFPFHYRDERTYGGFDRVFAKVPRARVFAETGIQFLPFNTLYQLECDVRSGAIAQGEGRCFLPIADFVNAWLCGKGVAEWSSASTTQCFNPADKCWSPLLANAVGIALDVFPPAVPSGTILGPILPAHCGDGKALGGTQVIAGCSHDTAAAVAAVPAQDDGRWAYLSSGTWSLLGVELPEPLMTPQALACGFTNEIGAGGRIRFLKNIAGMWLVQESLRDWKAKGIELSYDEMERRAEAAPALVSLINPNDPIFAAPGDMPEKIAQFCARTGQPAPRECGAVVRCIFESLALLYAEVLDDLRALTGRAIERIHIVGGGSRNSVLNRYTAAACNVEVLAGPAEATALGNVAVQAIALGDVADIEAARALLRRNFAPKIFLPDNQADWSSARARFAPWVKHS